MVSSYRIKKIDYKKPIHKDATNTSLPTTIPTIISNDEDITDTFITYLPSQEPNTTKTSS